MGESLELAERVLQLARAGDGVEAIVQRESSGFARFADSEVHQPTLIDNRVLHVSVLRDGRVGNASTNRLDDEGLAEVIQRAQEASASATPDPDFPGFAERGEIPAVDGYDEATARFGPGDQARLAAAAIDAADGLRAYGFATTGASELAIASTTGQRAEQAFTDATVRVLAAGDGISGFAEQTSSAVGKVDAAATTREATEKARRTAGAVDLQPGSYRAVLEPYALAELLQWWSYSAFNGLAFLEERSPFTGRIGTALVDPTISISDDALDPVGLPKAFDYEGTPKRRLELIADGVARDVAWDRVTAARAGRESTGHALAIHERSFGPLPLALSVAPGEAESAEELADLVADGIYVTRFHYLSTVDPREGVLTGTTRDGTFRIRNGRVAEPLLNLRWTIAVGDLLADVPGLTRDRLLVNQSEFYDDRYPYGALVPALATGRLDITGSGSGPGL